MARLLGLGNDVSRLKHDCDDNMHEMNTFFTFLYRWHAIHQVVFKFPYSFSFPTSFVLDGMRKGHIGVHIPTS
jgi:hypothetical protein